MVVVARIFLLRAALLTEQAAKPLIALTTGAVLYVGAGCQPAFAFPIAEPGKEGSRIVVSNTSAVVATYQGNSALYSNDLYLMLDGSGSPGNDGDPANDRLIFNNHT